MAKETEKDFLPLSDLLTNAPERHEQVVNQGSTLKNRFETGKFLGRVLGAVGLGLKNPEIVFVGGVGILTINMISAIFKGLKTHEQTIRLEEELRETKARHQILYGQDPRLYVPPVVGKKGVKGVAIIV